MNAKRMDADQIKLLPKLAIAHKHSCSVQYVRKILKGESGVSSERSRKILKDSFDILSILERETFPLNG